MQGNRRQRQGISRLSTGQVHIKREKGLISVIIAEPVIAEWYSAVVGVVLCG